MRTKMRLLQWFMVVAMAVMAPNVDAQLFYHTNGVEQVTTAVQLWYNGYWKHPGWINGTMVLSSAPDTRGKIVCFENVGAPYDKFLLQGIQAGARAIVILRDRSDTPGQAMFYVKLGSDQSRFNVPVVEILQPFNRATSVHNNWGEKSMEVSIWPQENEWKKANERTVFQLVGNV